MKTSLLLLSAISVHLSLSPPNPPSMVWLGVLTETLAPAIYNGSKTELECHPVLSFGAALRIWCFKKLGPMFTFEITIRPKHELVTSGPYAWVRHPSYMGVYLTLIGATLALGGAPNSWIASKGVWTIPGTHARLRTEDQVLKEAFGVEWEEYAARVPWKLIPGLF
ncbi:Isoprenylcysteine carboxyl methyltransferase family-domain-containing protein [Coprinopsis sp. MPI-PUGE-AT-0042]|nr:Isoprenylcysteine carboxyl methyltransferase family-domain-containing protein [Coprinopsis sp. MPI-PUGE-AT-0042]